MNTVSIIEDLNVFENASSSLVTGLMPFSWMRSVLSVVKKLSMNVSIHFWISLWLRSYSPAASTMGFWLLINSKTKSTLRLAVDLSIFGWLSPFLSTTHPLLSNYTAYYWYSRSGGSLYASHKNSKVTQCPSYRVPLPLRSECLWPGDSPF